MARETGDGVQRGKKHPKQPAVRCPPSASPAIGVVNVVRVGAVVRGNTKDGEPTVPVFFSHIGWVLLSVNVPSPLSVTQRWAGHAITGKDHFRFGLTGVKVRLTVHQVCGTRPQARGTGIQARGTGI